MPLIIVTGYPCSGKTSRSEQLVRALQKRIDAAATDEHRQLRIVHINDQTLNVPRTAYSDARAEKTARAALASAIKRDLQSNVIVVADALNYIKGFRYQLYCEAKAARTPSCIMHVGTPVEQCRMWNAGTSKASPTTNTDSPSVTTPSKDVQDAPFYPPELFDNLIFRYEEPNAMSRWDSPLFTVVIDDAEPPIDRIWEAMFGIEGETKMVKPNQATVLDPASQPDALYAADQATNAVTTQIASFLAAHPGETGGTMSIAGAETALQLPTGRAVTIAQLQRLRREFLVLMRSQASRVGTDRLPERFVGFLNARWDGN